MSQYRSRNIKRPAKATPSLPIINPHAAGIDVGSDFMFVAVPIDSSPTPIARFGTFTSDLLDLAAHLKECRILTVAIESTGVYWIPLYEILEAQGFKVMLINPNYPKKNKTDVEDCQWLQYLHSVGLLKGSFRPPEQVCAVREILRHRATLVRQGARDILRMQKSLTQMNVLIHNVISDITGLTGLLILDAILAGERDPQKLALFRDPHIKATPETIEKSLIGNYRAEHLFTLKQSRESYRFHREQIEECDAQIEKMLKEFDGEMPISPTPGTKPGKSHGKNDIRLPHGNLHSEMIRVHGVDLATVPGIAPTTACTIFTEIGRDITQFESASAFVSWLKLCPDPRISGGKVLGHSKCPSKPKLSVHLRQIAQSMEKNQSYLGHFYRRMKSKHGPATAAKATAQKLARIIYTMLTTKQPYDESHFVSAQKKLDQGRIRWILQQAPSLGLTIQQTSVS